MQWELQQRKQLSSQCRKLESEKEQVANQIVSKQERLEKLAPQLKSILEVTKPLQEQLGMQADQIRQEHQLAHLLPNPLYLLYAKVDAYSQVFDKNIIVHILGEEEDAKQLKKEDAVSQISTVDSEESDQEDANEVSHNITNINKKKIHLNFPGKIRETKTPPQKIISSYRLKRN